LIDVSDFLVLLKVVFECGQAVRLSNTRTDAANLFCGTKV
jgi:hypothetical protein